MVHEVLKVVHCAQVIGAEPAGELPDDGCGNCWTAGTVKLCFTDLIRAPSTYHPVTAYLLVELMPYEYHVGVADVDTFPLEKP